MKIHLFAAGAIVLATATGIKAADWQIELIDQTGAGKFSSLKMDKDGNAHVAYVDDDGMRSLKYGFWDHKLKRWFTMTVDQHASFCSLALDSKQFPRISYVDSGTVRGAKLRYARWNGTSWEKEPLPLNADVISFYTSIALDKQDKPSITYYEYEGPEGIGFVLRLRIVSWNGMYWEARTVDQEPGSGKFNSIAIDSAGHAHIAYANVKAEHASLRYAHWNGHDWEREVLDGATAPSPMYSVALVLDKHDIPHIVYSDANKRLVKYATRQGGTWKFEAVDALRQVGYPDRNGIALDEMGNPYISFYDEGLGILKLACRKGDTWSIEIVDRNFSGYTSSVQANDLGIWISYADETGRALKIARKTSAQTGLRTQQAPALTGKLLDH